MTKRCYYVTVVIVVRGKLLFSYIHCDSFSGFHIFCLDPPLNCIPKGEWYCHMCFFDSTGDFGFDEGEEHSLSSFQARDLEFRRRWWAAHPPNHKSPPDLNDPTVTCLGNTVVTEYDVENEFWRLVQSPDETVEVEYGADVHSTTHGRYDLRASLRFFSTAK